MRNILICLTVGAAFPFMGIAGSFVDLDFENVQQPITVIGGTPVDEAFPGWTVTQNGVVIDRVHYNMPSFGSEFTVLYSTFPPGTDFGARLVIGGNYSAGLESGFGPSVLSQIGTIPVGSRSLLFDSIGDGFLISLGGLPASAINLGQGTTPLGVTYNTYGVDVTSLAGIDIKLELSSAALRSVVLDNVRFSNTALVPEPSTYALLAAGGVALLVILRLRTRQHHS